MMVTTLNQRSHALAQAWSITQEMLIAAHQGQWEELVVLQEARQTKLQVLADLHAPFQADDVACIQNILQAEPELACLTLAGRSEFARLLKELAMGRSMTKTYVGNSGL